MTNIWIFDCEGDSLRPTKFHCLAASKPKGSVFVTPKYEDMKKFLQSADVLIGHNICRWDIPNLERVLGIKIKAKLVDTLALSWYLYPDRFKHGLDSWGEDLGTKKPIILDWENQTQEEYEHRSKTDVEINTKLWNLMYQYLMSIYGSDKKIWKLLDYLSFKMRCARLKEESGWKLDVDNVRKSLEELETVQTEKKEALINAMPQVPVVVKKTKPKRFLKADGSYSKLGMEWVELIIARNLPLDYEGEVEITKGYEQGNPSSPDQMKNWLYSLGWVPQTFKYVKNKETGELRDIPQLNLEHGKGICPSIKLLYEKEPALELLDGLSVLQHRIGILKGFLRDCEDGFLKAQIQGFTNTLRVQHTTIVNLPKVDKLYAKSIRASLIARDGYTHCGADLSSLEDKIKQHLIYPYDREFVESMNKPGWDPHLEIAKIAGMCTEQQVEEYKWYASLTDAEKAIADKVRMDMAKKIKPIRDIAKNGNYA